METWQIVVLAATYTAAALLSVVGAVIAAHDAELRETSEGSGLFALPQGFKRGLYMVVGGIVAGAAGSLADLAWS